MRFGQTRMTLAAAAAVLGFTAAANAVTYNVGNNPAALDTIVVVNSVGPPANPNFQLQAGIDHNPSADNLYKDFTNDSGSGISSGQNLLITETFTNDGSETWTAWDELVVSTTDGIPAPSPGFLFQTNGTTVRRNGALLTDGVDYTLVGVPYNNAGNNGYISITISLSPASYIQPGDVLEIEKRIHEVSGDANPWRPAEAARVAQYPTAVPEPASLGLLALAAVACMPRRR